MRKLIAKQRIDTHLVLSLVALLSIFLSPRRNPSDIFVLIIMKLDFVFFCYALVYKFYVDNCGSSLFHSRKIKLTIFVSTQQAQSKNMKKIA